MFSGVRMRFIIVVLFVCFTTSQGKSTKKYKDDSAVTNKKLIGKSKPLPPAIIAIEIVDPNQSENKTSKNSKRTIDSSLGYGYQSPPKYQVYRYSQRDIPPYRGSPHVLSGGIKSHHYDIQKSVSYNLPSQSYKTQNLNQYYRPGTTLYSTVNSQGHTGGLSSHLPQTSEPHVPVIILKVYPSQLSDPSASLHANLPQTHPLASVVNSIDVQALLTKYVQNLLLDQQQQYHYQYQQQPAQEYQYQYVQQPQYQTYDTHDELLTHENYPKDTHTRVVFRTDKNKAGVSPPTETKTIQIAVPEGAYSSVQVQTPEMHYGYTSPGDGSAQQYYYQQYYYPDNGYQQVEAQQQIDYVPTAPAQEETPYNYHAHQKRSKQARFLIREEDDADEVIKLDPIKA